ncbi:MAG: hypothetical protein ACJAXX_000001 [Roseivirga sp.]|jgi:hypothetical protein
MKSLKKVMLIAIMVMVSTISFANGNKPNVKVQSVGAKTIALSAIGFGTGETQIKLVDEKGTILHIERIVGKNEYSKKFDLSSLKVGTYYIEVENETSFSTISVAVSAITTNVLEDSKVVIMKPVIRRNGNLLDILLPGENTADVEVSIYDSNLKRVFNEKVAQNSDMRRYNLSQLARGGYSIKMITEGKEFIQFVAVK